MFEAPGHDTPDLGGGQGVSNATKIVIRHAEYGLEMSVLKCIITGITKRKVR